MFFPFVNSLGCKSPPAEHYRIQNLVLAFHLVSNNEFPQSNAIRLNMKA